jgi:hypothetical protein
MTPPQAQAFRPFGPTCNDSFTLMSVLPKDTKVETYLTEDSRRGEASPTFANQRHFLRGGAVNIGRNAFLRVDEIRGQSSVIIVWYPENNSADPVRLPHWGGLPNPVWDMKSLDDPLPFDFGVLEVDRNAKAQSGGT